MRKSFFLMLLTVASYAYSGPWVGGGGSLIKDAANPWWIDNTKEVTFCVAQDKEHFHYQTSLGTLSQVVRNSLKWWQDQFDLAQGKPLWSMSFRVATQTFNEIDCDQDPNLRFQFGFLTPEQEQKLTAMGIDLSEQVSLAIRTSYDLKTFKGRGFIYIAPDSGRLHPNDPDMFEKPWLKGKGGLLTHALAHELGHVFGLVHSQKLIFLGGKLNARPSLMNSDFVQYIVTAPANGFDHFVEPSSFLIPTIETEKGYTVPGSGDNEEFFGMPPDTSVELRYIGQNKVNVYAWPHEHEQKPILIGQIDCLECHFITAHGADHIKLWIPPADAANNSFLSRYNSILDGIGQVELEGKAVYTSVDSRIVREIYLRIPDEGGEKQVIGELNGKMFVGYL